MQNCEPGMSAYAAFRRQPVPQQFAQNLQTITIPAPTRGLILSENEAFMQPGGAVVQTNWATTMKGVRLRGGCVRHCELPETTPMHLGRSSTSTTTCTPHVRRASHQAVRRHRPARRP